MDGKSTTIQLLVNNYPAFGFDVENAEQATADMFRRRIPSDEPPRSQGHVANKRRLEDHLNFRLIKGAFLGFQHIEYPGKMGTPVEMLKQLDTPDLPSFFHGISELKGRDWELGGLPFGKLASRLAHSGYRVEPQDHEAPNAIREMKNRKIGFIRGRDQPSIEDRMNMLPELVKIQFLRAFYSMRLPTEEEIRYRRAFDFPGGINDPVYSRYQRQNGEPIDSNDARNLYVREFVRALRNKWESGNNFDPEGFTGLLVPSFSDSENRVYFVQRNIFRSLRGDKQIERYDCTCYPGYQRMYERSSVDECKHIHKTKDQLRDLAKPI